MTSLQRAAISQRSASLFEITDHFLSLRVCSISAFVGVQGNSFSSGLCKSINKIKEATILLQYYKKYQRSTLLKRIY